MNKDFSKTAILVNVLIFVACVSVLPLLFLFQENFGYWVGYVFWIYVFILIILSSYSFSVYLRKKKNGGNRVMPGATLGVNPVKVQPKLALLGAFAIISGIIEIGAVWATIAAYMDPSPSSMVVMLTLPVVVINGFILLALICTYVSKKRKNV